MPELGRAMIIATRFLRIRRPDTDLDVAVRLFAPEYADGAWRCGYEIDWPEQRRASCATGYDAVQALHLALQKIGLDLYMSPHHARGELTWERPGDGYGFPVARNARDLLIGSDKIFEG